MTRHLPICLMLLAAPVSSLAQEQQGVPGSPPPAGEVPVPVPVPIPAARPPPADTGVKLAFGADLYLALQNWTKVHVASASSLGAGFGLGVGMGLRVDDMTLLVGPHLGYSRWSYDPSSGSGVYLTMTDLGGELKCYLWEDLYFSIGAGTSNVGAGIISGGHDVAYTGPTPSYGYRSVGLGAKWTMVFLGLNVVNYNGSGSDANRVELQLGLTL